MSSCLSKPVIQTISLIMSIKSNSMVPLLPLQFSKGTVLVNWVLRQMGFTTFISKKMNFIYFVYSSYQTYAYYFLSTASDFDLNFLIQPKNTLHETALLLFSPLRNVWNSVNWAYIWPHLMMYNVISLLIGSVITGCLSWRWLCTADCTYAM